MRRSQKKRKGKKDKKDKKKKKRRRAAESDDDDEEEEEEEETREEEGGGEEGADAQPAEEEEPAADDELGQFKWKLKKAIKFAPATWPGHAPVLRPLARGAPCLNAVHVQGNCQEGRPGGAHAAQDQGFAHKRGVQLRGGQDHRAKGLLQEDH